jgi:hypothetical protein
VSRSEQWNVTSLMSTSLSPWVGLGQYHRIVSEA